MCARRPGEEEKSSSSEKGEEDFFALGKCVFLLKRKQFIVCDCEAGRRDAASRECLKSQLNLIKMLF